MKDLDRNSKKSLEKEIEKILQEPLGHPVIQGQKLLTLFSKTLDDVIGEDEDAYEEMSGTNIHNPIAFSNNELRKQMRARKKELGL